MKTTQDVLREFDELEVRERAAAIAHYVYMKTAERIGWEKRVPVEWGQLQPDAQDFNVASVDTWVQERELYDAWLKSLEQLRLKE